MATPRQTLKTITISLPHHEDQHFAVSWLPDGRRTQHARLDSIEELKAKVADIWQEAKDQLIAELQGRRGVNQQAVDDLDVRIQLLGGEVPDDEPEVGQDQDHPA